MNIRGGQVMEVCVLLQNKVLLNEESLRFLLLSRITLAFQASRTFKSIKKSNRDEKANEEMR